MPSVRTTVLALVVLILPCSDLLSQSSRPASSPSSASAPASKSQSVSDFEQRLTRINGQIKDLRARLEAEARKESSVLTSLARINLNKSIVERGEIACDDLVLA